MSFCTLFFRIISGLKGKEQKKLLLSFHPLCLAIITPLLPLGQTTNQTENDLRGWMCGYLPTWIKSRIQFCLTPSSSQIKWTYSQHRRAREFFSHPHWNHLNMVSLARINILLWLLSASLTASHFISSLSYYHPAKLVFFYVFIHDYFILPLGLGTWYPCYLNLAIHDATNSNPSVRFPLAGHFCEEVLPERMIYFKSPLFIYKLLYLA